MSIKLQNRIRISVFPVYTCGVVQIILQKGVFTKRFIKEKFVQNLDILFGFEVKSPGIQVRDGSYYTTLKPAIQCNSVHFFTSHNQTNLNIVLTYNHL